MTNWRRFGRCAQPASDEHAAELQRALKDRSNLVVAAAAAVVGERKLNALAGELTAAFERFLVNPEKDDKLCRAKIAIIQALDRLEHLEPEIFYKAARHVQFEPVWNGQVDSAVPLRSAGLVAIARIGTGATCRSWSIRWPTPSATSGSRPPRRSGALVRKPLAWSSDSSRGSAIAIPKFFRSACMVY